MNSRDDGSKAIASLIGLVFLVIFYLWFYSVGFTGEAVIQSKWTESHTSCSDGDCTTSTSFLVQFEDGTVLDVFWGTRDWDRMIVGSKIRYSARGRSLSFFGWRLMQPSIFSFEQLEAPPR